MTAQQVSAVVMGSVHKNPKKPEPESTTARSSHNRGGGIGGFICTTEKCISKSSITSPPPLL